MDKKVAKEHKLLILGDVYSYEALFIISWLVKRYLRQ